jgi:proteasome lid subunit RPN8/RPN11
MSRLSAPFVLVLPQRLYREILVQAEAELPNECCGLLAGYPGTSRVTRRLPLVNALASPIEFESEPRSLFEAFRTMRREGLDVLAVYHSHPKGEAVPSRKDVERSYSPEVVNLIVSFKDGKPELRAWWLRAAGFEEANWAAEEEG